MPVSTIFHVPLLVLCLTVLSGAAVANDGGDPFEVLVISAVIGAREDLDLRPRADSRCRVVRGQDNLKRTLAEMERERGRPVAQSIRGIFRKPVSRWCCCVTA